MTKYRCTFDDLAWRATFILGTEDSVTAFQVGGDTLYCPWFVDDIVPLVDDVLTRLNPPDPFWEDYDRKFIKTCDRILSEDGLLRSDGHTASSFFIKRVRAYAGMPRVVTNLS